MITGATTSHAAERREGPLDARTVVLRGLAGELTVETGGSGGVEFRLTGEQDALDDVELRREGDTVVLDASREGSGSTTVVDSVTTIVRGPGATSEVTIGGSSSVSSRTSGELAVTVTMPADTSLQVVGFVGEATIGDLSAPLTFNASAANVRVGDAGRVALEVVGQSTFTVASVEEQLDASITGAGDITVEDGSVEIVVANLQGAGSLVFDGEAERAEVSIIGAGSVRLGRVENRPDVSIIGAGSFTAENW